MADDDELEIDAYPKSDYVTRVGYRQPKELISWAQIQALSNTANPTVLEAINALIEEIDEAGISLDRIDTLLFLRPIIGRTVIDSETGLPTFRDMLVGIDDDFDSMEDARKALDEKGVDAPSGGGGGGGSFYISEITSDQWQRIRRGEINEDEAGWENDEDNYDDDGEMRPFGEYADDEDDD